ncbi:MAG: PepSY domain-containing protein [Methylococcaceae bacterium]|nr:PepSY domain-containing protein [Methylococcaceae bacterium]
MKNSAQRILTRATWIKIHLYLALSIGLFLALLGLTGSISVYREELDELLNPQLVIDNPQGHYQSLDRMMVAVREAHPERHGSWTLEMPRTPYSMATAWYDKPRETFFELYAPLMVSVNPYTADVVASRFWGQTLTTWLLDLHTQLHWGRFGWKMVGFLGVLLMVSISTGLYLWWPGVKGLWKALILHHKNGMIRLLFDLHRFVGLFSALALLVLALSGFLLSYPVIMETLVGASGMQHGETGRTLTSTAVPNNHPTGLAAAAFVAQAPFPKAQLRRVTTPAGNTGIYRINFRQGFEINQRHPYTTVWVDRWSGQIKEVRNPANFSKSERFASGLWPLHTGEALGATGRFAWFAAGQSLFFLYVSGLMRWLNQRGVVKDREVNFAGLQLVCLRALKQAYSLSLQLISFTRRKLKQHAPYIIRQYWTLIFWLRRVIFVMLKRQKRIGKN